MATSLLLPIPLLTNPERRPKSTVPAYCSVIGTQKRAACIVCARSQDDCYATVKALTPKHYMLNSEINEQLAGSADVQEGDVVLVIGPGTGSLTNVLLNASAAVLAIEKDPHMVGLVRERSASTDQFKVVANIPFNISTDVVRQLLPMGDMFSEVVLLLQVKVAQVNSAFNGKRKMLRKTLQHLSTSLEIEKALGDVGLPATSRPEELTLDDFVKLHDLIGEV